MKLTDAKTLALALLNEHGLSDWTFDFDRAVKRFGHTTYDAKLITLSTKITEMNTENRVKNTILHEIAHALVGPGNGHNYTWRRKAVSIGCDGKRNYSHANTETPTLTYTATCLCNVEHKRLRKPKYQYYCKRCMFVLHYQKNK